MDRTGVRPFYAQNIKSEVEVISMELEKILGGESRNLEYKEALPDKSFKYMKSVVAFANGSGGRIVFGIRDGDRAVVGIPKDAVFKTMDAITNAISDSCEPAIIPDVVFQTVEDKTLIVVEIPMGMQRPYYIKKQGMANGTYIRVSGTTRPAGRDIIKELFYESEGRSYDMVPQKENAVSDVEIDNLCREMKEVALSNCMDEAQRRAVRDVTRNVLISWGVLAEVEGVIRPTNALDFLLGRDGFLSRIQCGVFKGVDRAVFVDKREYTGAMWNQIEEAYQFVLRNIHLGARLDGIYRRDIYELPPASIRELIVNAAVHCSFLQSSVIQVAVFDDRLEITSPGGLMPGVTIDKMKEGFSKVRNRAIASAFSYMNIIEQWGSGIPKIMNEMDAYGLEEPEFIDMECALRINLYRSRPDNHHHGTIDTNHGTTDTNESDPDTKGTEGDAKISLDENSRVIIALVKENPRITQKAIQEQSNVSLRTVKRIMAELQDKGIIKRKGNNRLGEWMVESDQEKN